MDQLNDVLEGIPDLYDYTDDNNTDNVKMTLTKETLVEFLLAREGFFDPTKQIHETIEEAKAITALLWLAWKTKDGEFSSKLLQFKDIDKLYDLICEHQDDEIYINSHLLKPNATNRKKESYSFTYHLHADLDGLNPKELLVKPSFMVETSLGHYHAYWALKERIDVPEAERIQRNIVHYHSNEHASKNGNGKVADRNTWNIDRILRLPDTVNHRYGKSGEKFLTRWIRDDPRIALNQKYNPSDFDAYNVAETATKEFASKSTTYKEFVLGEPVGFDNQLITNKINDAPEYKPNQGMGHTLSFNFACWCLENDLTPEQTYYAMSFHRPTIGKVREETGVGDVLASANKRFISQTIEKALEKVKRTRISIIKVDDSVDLTETDIAEFLDTDEPTDTNQSENSVNAESIGTAQLGMSEATRLDGEEQWWDANPRLKYIKQFSIPRLVSPWSVLQSTLTKCIAHTPPNVQLPPIVGSRASLNFYALDVGPPGAGKGASFSASKEVFKWPENDVVEDNPGSGQGLAHLFAYKVKNSETKQWEQIQYETKAHLFIDEIDTLMGLTRQNASTLLPTLRTAWSGGPLGHKTAEQERALRITGDKYRLCLSIGVQPERAKIIFDGASGGTTQRFTWMPVTDQYVFTDEVIAKVIDGSIKQPEQLKWSCPFEEPSDELNLNEDGTRTHNNGPEIVEIKIHAQIRKEIILERGKSLSDKDVTAHTSLVRLKVATAFMLLDERTEMSLADWNNAEYYMKKSNLTMNYVQSVLNEKMEREDRKRAVRRGRSEAITEKVKDNANTNETAKIVIDKLKKVKGEWVTAKTLKLGRKHEFFNDVIEYLASDNGKKALEMQGLAFEAEDYTNNNNRTFTHYRIVEWLNK